MEASVEDLLGCGEGKKGDEEAEDLHEGGAASSGRNGDCGLLLGRARHQGQRGLVAKVASMPAKRRLRCQQLSCCCCSRCPGRLMWVQCKVMCSRCCSRRRCFCRRCLQDGSVSGSRGGRNMSSASLDSWPASLSYGSACRLSLLPWNFGLLIVLIMSNEFINNFFVLYFSNYTSVSQSFSVFKFINNIKSCSGIPGYNVI